VVSNAAKGLAWVCVALLNLFFVYFSVIRGLQRGLDWQRLYAIACAIQFIAEVLLYETSECAMVNYFIPDLVTAEVQAVTFAIHQAIQSVCQSTAEENMPILDAPRYLFLSVKIAERFPELLESVIVRSYHSYSPGELSRKWKVSHGVSVGSTRDSGSRVRRVTFTGLLVAALQSLGSTSMSVQRFFIHAIQPAMMAGVVATVGALLTHPLYFLIALPAVAYGLYSLWDHWSSSAKETEDEDGEAAVVPLPITDPRRIQTSSSTVSQLSDNPPPSAPHRTLSSPSKDPTHQEAASVMAPVGCPPVVEMESDDSSFDPFQANRSLAMSPDSSDFESSSNMILSNSMDSSSHSDFSSSSSSSSDLPSDASSSLLH
jgi:hypothetical protein